MRIRTNIKKGSAGRINNKLRPTIEAETLLFEQAANATVWLTIQTAGTVSGLFGATYKEKVPQSIATKGFFRDKPRHRTEDYGNELHKELKPPCKQ